MEVVRREGQVVVVSLAWVEEPVLSVAWVGREVELKAAYGADPVDWQVSLALMEKDQVQVEPMLGSDSHVPLDGIQEAFESLIKPGGTAQLIVVP
jgi:threonine dehydrogenase-like Zn-dependent dehydrogenase